MPQLPDFDIVDRTLEMLYPKMESDLLALLAVPSVQGEAAPGAPFGRAVADALHLQLAICQRLGFTTANLDGYCGTADYAGEAAEQIGVLGHLDVVPAKEEEWQYAPYAPVVANGRIYGRGSVDDKGPTLAALYAAYALKECGLPFAKSLRFIFGCNEESGMECMTHYLKHQPQPSCGFTPDASFPLIVGEKGVFHYRLSQSWAGANSGPRLRSIDAGMAANVVPSQAVAVLADCRLSSDSEDIIISVEGDKTIVTALGRAAHASTPEEGDNAISKLLAYLSKQTFMPLGAKLYVSTLAELTEDDKHGAKLGVASQDELTQTTTCPTMIHLDSQGAETTFDIRFILSGKGADFSAKLAAVATRRNLVYHQDFGQEPLYLGDSHPLAADLLQSYREVSGDMSAPLIIGGGTYAKTMNNFLGFGPELAGDEPVAHQADEYISQERLLMCAKVYARAIRRLTM